jgi:hypothetical protein
VYLTLCFWYYVLMINNLINLSASRERMTGAELKEGENLRVFDARETLTTSRIEYFFDCLYTCQALGLFYP